MKVERHDGGTERAVLTGLLINKRVLGSIAQRWPPTGLFGSKYANLIGSWAVAFFRKYGGAPKSAIQQLFFEWAERTPDKELVSAVESLLVSVTSDIERVKSQFGAPEVLIDVAGKLFEKVRLKDLTLQVQAALDREDIEHARSLVEKSRKVDLGMGASLELFSDKGALERALSRKYEQVIECPGAMGNFYSKFLCRGGFLSYLAPAKRGKSYDLQDLAFRAVQQGRKVAYFELGDHSQEDVVVRLAVRSTGNPLSLKGESVVRLRVPCKLETNGKDDPDFDHYYENVQTLTLDGAWKTFEGITGDSTKGSLKLWCFPTGTMSVSGADAILEEQALDGWNADIVVFDYLDIAAPIDRKMDKLEATEETWKYVRGLTQKRHCLVVTATQCNREGFDARTLTREHIGGYYMKIAFVTALVGINQTPREKDNGLSRRNVIAGRDLDFGEKQFLWYAGNLATGNPCILSSF